MRPNPLGADAILRESGRTDCGTFETNRDPLTSIERRWSTASRTRYAYSYDDRGQRQNVVQSGDAFADYADTTTGAIHQNFAYNGRDHLRLPETHRRVLTAAVAGVAEVVVGLVAEVVGVRAHVEWPAIISILPALA